MPGNAVVPPARIDAAEQLPAGDAALEAVRLPPGVLEVIPDLLFVGPASAAGAMLRGWGVRRVVCCCSDVLDYESLLGPHRDAAATAAEESPPPPPLPHDGQEGNVDHEDEALEVQDGAEGGCPCLDDAEAPAARCGPQGAQPPVAYDGPEPLPLVVHHCAMDDKVDFPLGHSVPQGVEFISAMVAQGRRAREDEARLDPEGEGGDGAEVVAHAHAAWLAALTPRARAVHDMRHAVFVHCAAGTSRAPTVVAAFLLLREGHSLREIFEDLLPGDAVWPNPGFMRQLAALEEDITGAPTTLDLRAFFVAGLVNLFPSISEASIVAELDRAGGDVLAARRALMLSAARSFDRGALMVDSLCEIMQGAVPRTEVQSVFDACGQRRDAALLELMRRQAAAAELAKQEQTCGSREKSAGCVA